MQKKTKLLQLDDPIMLILRLILSNLSVRWTQSYLHSEAPHISTSQSQLSADLAVSFLDDFFF